MYHARRPRRGVPVPQGADALAAEATLFAVAEARDRLRGQTPPPFDPTAGHPAAAAGRAALRRGDWVRLARLYTRQSADGRMDWIAALAATWDPARALPAGADGAPALTVAGGVAVLSAAPMPDGAAPRAGDALRRDDGRRALDRAVRLNPGDPVPIGLRAGLATRPGDAPLRATLRERMTRSQGGCLLADAAVLQAHLAAGDADAAEAFRRERIHQGPAWLALDAIAADRAWQAVGAPPLGADGAAALRALQAPLLRGIAREASQDRSRLNWAHNAVGGVMLRMGDAALARPHLQAIGPFVRPPLWDGRVVADAPMASLNRLRRLAGLPPLLEGARADR